jgi:hypothetical protein
MAGGLQAAVGGGAKNVARAGGGIGNIGGAINTGVSPGSGGGMGPLDREWWSSRDPTTAGTRAGNKAREASSKEAGELYEKTGVLNKGLAQADENFKKSYDQLSGKYIGRATDLVNYYQQHLDKLRGEADSQAKDATKTYSNSILPEYKNAMGMAKKNASQAMTLAEAGDPNNPIMKQIRELYDQQGQKARQQGQQDFGVLSALGAQSAAGQFGASGPMTSGQMGQIYAANQSQAGDAYARAQQRMYDLQQQGIDKGFDQSNFLYQEGQNAQDRYGQSIQNLQAGDQSYRDQQAQFRDEIGGYRGQGFDIQSGLNADKYGQGIAGADIRKGNAYAGAGREQGALDQYYGVKQQGINNQLQANMAQQQAQGGLFGSLIGGAATVAASDKHEKQNISSITDEDLDQFLSAIKPKSFEYKDDDKVGRQPGKRIGFMLQDVQGTTLGDKMTRKGPEGELMYDKDNLNGIILAALARDAKKSA